MRAAGFSENCLLTCSFRLWMAAVLLFPPVIFAADEITLPAIIPAIVPAIANTGVKTVDVTREFVSQQFVSIISDVDRFFGNERNFQESNQSVLQLDLNEVMQMARNNKAQMTVRAKLNLPSTEQRFHLLVEGDPEKNTTGTDNRNQTKTISQIAVPQNYGVAVRYEKQEEEVWHFSNDLGIKVRAPLQPFARTRLSFATPLADWRMKIAQSEFWFNSIGFGETTQLDFEHSIGEPALFRATSTATWLHDLQNFDVRQDFTVYHTLDEKRALLYQASVVGVTHPVEYVTDYVFSVLYRQQFHRRWLFYEINPQLHFPHDSSYRRTPVLILRLEMLFDTN
jgi:hypothetical protein